MAGDGGYAIPVTVHMVREDEDTPWDECKKVGDGNKVGTSGELVVALKVYEVANGGLPIARGETRCHILRGHLGTKAGIRISKVSPRKMET